MMTIGLRPAALGPGESGTAAQLQNLQQQTVLAAGSGAATAGPPTIAVAVTGPATPDAPAVVDTRRIAREGDEARVIGDTPAGDSADAPLAQPAGPLRSFAQIPTEVMQEISRLREEAAEQNAQGAPGRNDPTPLPAGAAAIGSGEMPNPGA